MKQLTLQEHYNLIKEGKGHKDMFLKAAKSQFPNIVPNAATFEQTSTLLKQRSIISETIWGVSTGKITQPDWFSIFNDNINEAKYDSSVASSQEEPVKNNDKKVSKEVEENLDNNFDYKDPKNRDNVYGQEFLNGYYTEMKDPKNADKTVDELLELVSKNLAKDKLHYVKDGQFGVKGLGYTEDAPGLSAGKEAKGKYKSSGYGDLKENKNPMFEGLGDGPLDKLFYKEYPKTKNEILKFLSKHKRGLSADEKSYYVDRYMKMIEKDLKENYETYKPKGPQNDAFHILLKKYSKDQIEKTWDKNYDDIKQHYNDLNKANRGSTNVAQELANFIGKRINENTSINEAPAINNPKIEKIVAGINELISKAIDEDGDPIGVIDTTGTWQEPYVYSPIEYKNGALKIISKSVYGNDNEVDIIKKSNMEFDGIPTLRNIMKMYKRALKKNNINENNMIKLMDLFEGEDRYYIPEKKEKKKPMAEKKKVKKSAIADRVKQIEEESIFNAMEGKIQAMAEEIEMRENKLSMIDENEDLQEFINPIRIKEMQKEIDELKKTKEKMEKEYEKKSKGRKPKEVIDETEIEEEY
jgi:hypothetical protein